MNLLCHHATVRPTIARCIAQIEELHSKHAYVSLPGLRYDVWNCALGDVGFVEIEKTGTHLSAYDIGDMFKAIIRGKSIDLTRAEIHAICRATQMGHWRSFAKLPKPKTLTPNP